MVLTRRGGKGVDEVSAIRESIINNKFYRE